MNMKRIRQGNDFLVTWRIKRAGINEDLTQAVNMSLVASVKSDGLIHSKIVPFDIVDNSIVRIEVTPEIAQWEGIYNFVLKYEFVNPTYLDNNEKCAVDKNIFIIVPRTSQADEVVLIECESDVLIGLKGKKGDSAFTVWNKENGGNNTYDDWLAFLQSPATEIEGIVSANEAIRVENENTRKLNEIERKQSEQTRLQNESARVASEIDRAGNEDTRSLNEATRLTNEEKREQLYDNAVILKGEVETLKTETETAKDNAITATNQINTVVIPNAETATQNATNATIEAQTATQEATTAASLADTARLAIQDDLAQKADHGYASIEVAKTLKEVDDEIVQLAGDTGQLFAQSDLESGYFAPVIDTRLAMSPLAASNKWYMIIDVREGESFTLFGRSVEDKPRTYAVLDNKRFVIKLAPRYTAWDANTPIEIVIPDGGVKLLIQVMNPNTFRLISNKVGTYLKVRVNDLNSVLKYYPVNNKILNIHKYGVPSEITSSTQANLWNEDDFFYHPSIFRCTNIRTPINGKTGKYFGVVIDTETNVNIFNTRDVNDAVIFQHESLTNANKKIIYVDLSIGDVDKTFLYLSGQVKIYDIFLTDEVPTFNLIPYEINDEVKWEDLFWKDRDTFTPVITTYTYNVIAQPADIRLNNFKRYVFFRVRSSLPDTRPQTFFFDILDNNFQIIKRSHVRWSREWAYVDLGENLDSIRYLRLLNHPGTQAQGGSWLQLYDMRTSDSLSLNAVRSLDYPSFETAFEGKDRKLDYFRVGSKIFTGSAPSVIRKDNDFTKGGWSDLSMYDYTGKKISFKEARKQKVVDLASRYLSCITPEGEMYFKNGAAIEKIDVETFLNSIQSHDGTGLDYSRLSYINLPTDATDLEKQAAFDSMKTEWYQFTGATEQVSPSGGKEIGQMFDNGSILFGTTLVREDGTIATPVLKNPVAANPTHLIIKDESDAVLHEIPLYGNIEETYRWGSFIPDEGSINYAEHVESIINFTNEKTLTVALPTSLVASTYKIVLRGRRFGTTLVNGDVEISSNDITLGTISLSGTGTKRELIDNEISVTTSSAINEIKMTLSCATEKPLTVGNGMSGDGSWGRTADGKFGTIVEYVPAPARGAGKCYFTQDYGETWEDVFDVGLNELFEGSNKYHLHGARYDRYWNKLYIVGGDHNENRPFHHANISSETTIDNIAWEHEPMNKDVYRVGPTEQYCTVYPDVDHIHFGTDYVLSGMWRMNRINKNVMTGREPSFIVASYRITHIPTSYFKADDGELFALSMLGGSADVNFGISESTYRSMRLDATKDGVTWKEVWRNDVGGGAFGMNAYMNVHYFDNKLFLHIYGDGKFSTDHSLVILDYK